MTKEEFFSKIRERLTSLPTEDVESSLSFYSEMIDDAIEDGMTCENAIASMGSVDDIAAQILADFAVEENGSTDARDSDTVVVNAPFESIFIRAVDHEVTLSPTSDRLCSVRCEDFDKHFTVSVRGKTLYIVRKRRKFSFLPSFSSRDITVFLPVKDYRELKAETVSGDLRIGKGLSFGKCVLTAVSGDIDFSASASSGITAQTTSGDVAAAAISGEKCKIVTVSGDIELADSVCTSLVLETVSGDMEFSRCDGEQVTLKSVSGSIKGTLLSAKNFATRTVGGSVRCPYPDENGGKCSVSTVSGNVDINVVG